MEKDQTTRFLKFKIESGAKVCASTPGKFCRFCILSNRPTCYLFGDLNEKDGWVQRHPDCLENEMKQDKS